MEELRAAQSVLLLCSDEHHADGDRGHCWAWDRRRVARLQSKSRQSGKRILSGDKQRNWGGRRKCAADLGGRRRVSGSVAGTGQRRWTTGGFPVCERLWRKTGSTRESLGGVSTAGPSRLAEGGTGHPSSQKRSASAVRVEKNSPKRWQALLKPEEVRDRRIRLMFQDEARFGRMVESGVAGLRRRATCGEQWLRAPVCLRLRRGEPDRGRVGLMICPKMNTERMGDYLSQVALAHPRGSSSWSSTEPVPT